MLKRIQIDLAHPFCNCEKQDVSWLVFTKRIPEGVTAGELRFECRLCKAKLEIPYEGLRALINFVQPYPDGLTEKEVELPDGSKLNSDKFFEGLEKQMAEDK